MKRLLLLISLIVLISPLHSAYSAVSLRCDNCSEQQRKTVLTEWGYPNISLDEVQANVKKVIHITDFSNNTIFSYELQKLAVFLRPNQPPQTEIKITPITTPSDVKNTFDRIVNEVKFFKSSIEKSSQIPKTVIGSAWEFVNCLYCQSHVSNYLNQQMSTQIEAGLRTVNALALSLGLLKSPLPNTYKIALESGGYLYISIEITGDTELYIKVVEVVDQDGNSVPNSSTSLTNARVYISGQERALDINLYINPFNLSVPTNRKGTVTIQRCREISGKLVCD